MTTTTESLPSRAQAAAEAACPFPKHLSRPDALAVDREQFRRGYLAAAKSERLAAMRECAEIICEGCNGEIAFNGFRHVYEDSETVGSWECKALKIRAAIAKLEGEG